MSKSTRNLTPTYKEFWELMLARGTSQKFGQPFLAPAYFSLKPVNSPGLGTLAVDKHWNCYVDFEFAIEKGIEWSGLVTNHEVWHLLRDHSARFEALEDTEFKKNHKLWNYAGDMEINDDLWYVPEGREKLIPEEGLIPERGELAAYKKGDFAEHYYFQLRDDPNISKKQEKGDGEGEGSGDGEGEGSGSGSGSGKGGKGQVDLTNDADGNCGSGAGNADTLGDYALDSEDASENGVSEIESDLIKREVAQRIQNGNGVGNQLGGSITDWAANYLLEKPIDWRRELRSTLSLIMGNSKRGRMDYSYIRPSRRQPLKGVIMPGMTEPKTRFVMGVDTSGSNMHNFQLILDEGVKISKSIGVRGRDFGAFAVDVAVDKMEFVNNPAKMLQSQRMNGGTQMRPAYEFVAGLRGEKRPNVFLLVTDGEVSQNDFPTSPPAGIKGITVVTAIVMTGNPGDAHNERTLSQARERLGKWSKVIALYNVGGR